MSLYKRGKVWWYKFTWQGELIRESTKQASPKVFGAFEKLPTRAHENLPICSVINS